MSQSTLSGQGILVDAEGTLDSRPARLQPRPVLDTPVLGRNGTALRHSAHDATGSSQTNPWRSRRRSGHRDRPRIILHITTIRVLLANRRRVRDEHTSVATSAMTASG